MNLLLIVFALLFLVKVVLGYKVGIVKEVIMLVTVLIASVTVGLIANGLNSYTEGHVLNIIIVVVLLSLLGSVQLLLKPLFFSAKLIVKLPIVSWVDKLLGGLLGILESFVIIWAVYFFVMIMDLGPIGTYILEATSENAALRWLFEHNFLVVLLQMFSSKIEMLPDLLR